MKIISYACVLWLCIILGSNTLHAQWVPSQGLDGADVSDVVVLDSMVFICTSQNGLYERNVIGGNWEFKSSASCQEIEKCQSALFTWAWYSCQRSLDQGMTWQNMINAWNIGFITSMCTIDSSLFVSASQGPTGIIYRSDDMGNTIYPVMNNLPSLDNGPNVAAGDGSTLFCFQTMYDKRLFQSVDKGLTWDSISQLGLPVDQYETSCMCSLGGTMWLSTTEGLFAKNNNSGNWTQMSDTLFFRKMGIMNGVLFGSSTEHGLFRFNPVLNQWIPENTGLESLTVNGFCTDGNRLFVATDLGPYKCNTPYTWLPFYDGLNQATVSTMAFLGNETWAVISRGTFISTDQGATFSKFEMTGMPRPDKLILTDSADYALASGSFYWSHDHGQTWTKQHTGLPSPQQPPFLVINSMVCMSGQLFIGTNMGLFKTSCQQINWTKITSFGTSYANLLGLYSDDSTLLVEKDVYTNNYYYYTFRSTNFGQTFDSIIGLPAESPLIYENDGIDFYGLSHKHLYKSTDDGISWNEIPVGNSYIYAYLLSASKPAVIVGGSKLGITLYDLYLSVTYNDGLTWTDIQDNLPVPQWPVINLLEINQQRTFVAPSMKGLWYRDGLLTGFRDRIPESLGQLRICPNPTRSAADFIIDLPHATNGEILIYEMSGNLLYRTDSKLLVRGRNTEHLNLKDIAAGLYLVLLKTDEATYHSKLQIIN